MYFKGRAYGAVGYDREEAIRLGKGRYFLSATLQEDTTFFHIIPKPLTVALVLASACTHSA